MSESVLPEYITKFKKEFDQLKDLLIEVDEIAVSSGFQVTKLNGSEKYVYLVCKRRGQPIPFHGEKKRDKKSNKIGICYIFL